MIPCKVYHDLILLYVSEECTEETSQLVEEHLKTCSDCQKYYQSLLEPITQMESETDRLDEKAKDFEVKKSFLKIRKRWFFSLVSVILILVLTIGVGYLTYNQARGEGICFTNQDELRMVNSFFKAVKNGNYEKAFSMLDIEEMYQYMIDGQVEELQHWQGQYQKVTVGKETLYVNDEVYNNEYQHYLADEDEASFWAQILNYNSEIRGYVVVPADEFSAAAKRLEAEEPLSFRTNDYTVVTNTWGESYYVQKNGSFYSTEAATFDSSCIPAPIYERGMTERETLTKRVSACADYYEKMGFQNYKEKQWKEFLSKMEYLESIGITIEDYSIGAVYYVKNSDGDKGYWNTDVKVKCSGQYEESITVRMSHSALQVIGGYGVSDLLRNNLDLPEDVDTFYTYTYTGENELWNVEYKVNETAEFTEKENGLDVETEAKGELVITYKGELAELSSVKHMEISYECNLEANKIVDDYKDGISSKTFTINSVRKNGALHNGNEIITVTIKMDGDTQTLKLQNK